MTGHPLHHISMNKDNETYLMCFEGTKIVREFLNAPNSGNIHFIYAQS